MTEVQSTPRKRRLWPWIVLGVLVLIVAFVALAPALLSGYVASSASTAFSVDHRGRLEIGSLELAWFSPQKIEGARLLDPSGAEVARVSAELPSLYAIVGSGGKRIGKVVVEASADFVAADDGTTNLQRALEPTDEARRRAESESETPGEPTDLGGLLRELDLDLELRVASLKWSDARSRSLGKPFELADVVATARAKPGQPLAAEIDGKLASEGNVPLKVSAKVTELFTGAELNPNARFELAADVQSLPTGLVDALSGTNGIIAALFGERLRLTARGSGTLKEGGASIAAEGDSGRLNVDCTLKDGVLRGDAEPSLLLLSDLDPARAQRLLAALLPDASRLELGKKLSLRIDGLVLPLPSPFSLDAMLAGLEGKLELKLDALTYSSTAPKAVARGTDLTLGVEVAPTEVATPISATLTASLAGGGSSISVSHPDLRSLAAAGIRGSPEPIAVVVDSFCETAWLETWVGTDLGLAQKLGPEFSLRSNTQIAWPKDRPLAISSKVFVKLPKGTDVDVVKPNGIEFDIEASIEEPERASELLAAGSVPEATVKLDLSQREVLHKFLPPASEPTLSELLGEKLSVSLHTQPIDASDPGDGARVSCELKAEHVELSAQASVVKRELRIDSDEHLRLAVEPTHALLDRYVAASLPQGAKLAFTGSEPRIELEVRDARLPLDAWMPAEGQAPAPLADVIRRAAAQVKLSLTSLRYEQPPLAGAAKPVPIDVEELALAVTLASAKPASAQVTGRVAGAEAGRVKLDATCADPGAFFVDGADLPPLELQGDIAGLPTALVDALAAQEGLLVDVLGPSVDLELGGAWPSPPDQPLRAKLKSQHASVDLVALFQEKSLVASGSQGLNATLPLTPLFSKRVVGNLVPLLLNASKPEGAKPLALSVSDFALPLDGDLRKLNGIVKLDLGEIAYDLVPGLSSALASAGAAGLAQKRFVLEPLTIPIVNGVARYDRLPLKLGGQDVIFKGSFDLATREMELSTDLPLKALGSKVERELDAVRQYLDPDLRVPIRLEGAWNKPKLSLGKDFLEKVVKKAAENALKKGLLDLLDKKKD